MIRRSNNVLNPLIFPVQSYPFNKKCLLRNDLGALPMFWKQFSREKCLWVTEYLLVYHLMRVPLSISLPACGTQSSRNLPLISVLRSCGRENHPKLYLNVLTILPCLFYFLECTKNFCACRQAQSLLVSKNIGLPLLAASKLTGPSLWRLK